MVANSVKDKWELQCADKFALPVIYPYDRLLCVLLRVKSKNVPAQSLDFKYGVLNRRIRNIGRLLFFERVEKCYG